VDELNDDLSSVTFIGEYRFVQRVIIFLYCYFIPFFKEKNGWPPIWTILSSILRRLRMFFVVRMERLSTRALSMRATSLGPRTRHIEHFWTPRWRRSMLIDLDRCISQTPNDAFLLN